MATPLALVWDLIAVDKASAAFTRVGTAAARTATETDKATVSIASFAKKASAAALVGFGVAIDQAAKFQKSMTLIQTAGGESLRNVQQLATGVQNIAKQTGTSLGQLSDGIYIVAKAAANQKWSATGQLEVLKAAAEGAKAENVDLGTAVTALTSVMSSYGAKASDAVSIENELIRGAGLAKTTYQDFSASLSNVLPLASALHISFQQVAGAIATMTQHGESAQQSTDNLRNLISNLAGQNNVAAHAMQQLGINTVDLREKLGTRGLTGTLQVVEDALAKNEKGGLVVVDAFKKAQLATSSLQTEIQAMPPALQKQSEAFEKGQVSFTDYRKYVRSLGGDQYQLGMNFLTTMGQAKGFSDQLKSGNGTIATAAQMLQKMLGGQTGLNVALMLGGTSAAGFKSAVDAVGAAAKKSGADVLGWSETSNTLAVKIDKAKENLQVFAVEVGTALLPIAAKIADAIGKVVQWFENLSGTQKQIVGWSAAAVAALGPILSIGSKLANAAKGFAVFAGASEMAAGRVAVSTQRIMGALAGAGLVYGSTQVGGVGGHIMGALGGAATGAAIGSFFGPLGTAIGGVAGSLAGLGLSYLHTGDSAKAAAQKQQEAAAAAQRAVEAQKQAVDSLAASMQADNDKLAENTRLQVENDLHQKGAFTLAAKLGVSTKTITDAVLGNVQAQGQLAALAAKIESTPGLVGAGGTQNKNLADLNNLLASEGVNLHAAALEADQYAQANGKLNLAARSVAAQFAMYGTSLNTATLIGKQNIAFINAHVAALLSQRAAGKSTQAQFDASIGTLRAQLTQYGYSTAQVDAFTTALRHVPASVLTDIEKHGVTPAEIQAIIDKYSQVPTYKNTNLTVSDHASGVIASVAADLRRLGDKTVTVTEVFQSIQSSAKASQADRRLYGSAAGGGLPLGWSAVGEHGAELIYNHGGSAHVFSNEQSRAILAATGMRAPGFAGGTASSSKVFDNLTTALEKFTQAVTRSSASLQSSEDTLSSALKAAGASKSTLNRAADDFAKLNALQAQLGTKTASMTQTAYDKLSTVMQSFTSEVSTVSQAITSGFSIVSAGQSGNGSSLALQQIAAKAAGGYALTPAEDQLMNNGGVSFGSIMGSLSGQIGAARSFRSGLATLTKEGLGAALIQQLGEAGPGSAGATVSALLSASPAQIKQLSRSYATLQGLGAATGKDIATTIQGKQLKAAEDTVSTLRSGIRQLSGDIRGLVPHLDRIAGVGQAAAARSRTVNARR